MNNEIERMKKYILIYKNEFKGKINIKDNIKFGVEIEFTTYNHKPIKEDLRKTGYDFVRDGSGVAIFEAVSPILVNKEEDWNQLNNVLNIINKYDSKLTSREGGHIHFDQHILDKSNIDNFLKLWYCFENIIYTFANGDFYNARYSEYLYARKLQNEIQDKLNNKYYDFFDKDYGLNLSNIFGDFKFFAPETYEVRCPNATLNITTWQNNILFFARLFSFANDKGNEKIINSLYAEGIKENNFENAYYLSRLIFDNNDDRLCFLKQYSHICGQFLLNDSQKKKIRV